jgi:bis(5'-nucleosyl)-tetraphosphatase (symmetrical)
MGARRIFVGDIQGCRAEFEELLETVRFDPAADVLHPVGDLVNRGPDSLGALRLCKELGARPVLGNHDLHLLRAAAGLRAPAPGDTLDELLAAPDRDELLAWLAAQPFVRVFDDLYLVHAGLHPRWDDPVRALAGADPLAPSPAVQFATRVRYCDAHGERPADDEAAPPGFEPWDRFYEPSLHGGRRVVFGHWAARGLVRTEKVIGLDSGCVWGGALSAWIPEERRVVSVPAQRVWQTPSR